MTSIPLDGNSKSADAISSMMCFLPASEEPRIASPSLAAQEYIPRIEPVY